MFFIRIYENKLTDEIRRVIFVVFISVVHLQVGFAGVVNEIWAKFTNKVTRRNVDFEFKSRFELDFTAFALARRRVFVQR